MIEVKELLSSDQDEHVIALAKEFASVVPLNEWVDPEILKDNLIVIRGDMDRKYLNVFIAYSGTRPIGLLVGITYPLWYRHGIAAEQKLWYVQKSSRGSKAAIALIKAYEEWARLNGATQIFTGTANALLSEKTIKLLAKLGYAQCGALLVKEI